MIVILSLSVLCFAGCSLAAQISFSTPSHQDDTHNVFITPEINNFIEGILEEYNSPGLSLALVRRNETSSTGWLMEFGSYGTAKADGSPVTPDSLFAIASNSKLFLSLSVGLLIENQTLADQTGRELSWSSRAIDVIPQWGLMDEDMERIVNIQDMLSHRTGMPRHDLSGRPLQGGVAEMISNLRYLRPSAEARETWQYNNLMYETLSYLPELLLDQPFESYVADHLFNPLNMSASTYSVAIAEESSEHMAHGYMRSMRDEITGVSGILTPVVPYFSRPGNEKIWAGAGGVITSARDLSVWVAMLLGNGKHPFTNVTVVPEKLIQHIAEGVAVIDGTPSYPELSASMYGAGQERYTYRGHDLIEHGGSNPGFKTQVTRFPNDNLGIVVLSNDEDFGTEIHQIVIRRIADEILGLDPLDWKIRLQAQRQKFNAEIVKMALPRPEAPHLPTAPIASMEGASFMHPTYGLLQPCYIEPGSNQSYRSPHSECTRIVTDEVTQEIIKSPLSHNSTLEDTLAIPTLIIPYNGFFVTHIMLRHFCGNLFNGSIIWSNWVVREKEGYHQNNENVGKDIIIGFDNRFEVEWVHETKSARGGLAFKGGFWGKGKKAKAPMGTGKESAEVWFGKV
ncbi:beta-lactamase transpeptidase-like protein [Lentinula edodes]|uniref:Beta-lactamase transpeptidase-like protein n=1 Tax=Lentinula edodes TaxID=5353 RepID=A0A1Q3DX89_LENED|nr:beta-lactamase/transpeptidase-like protein [Lentinula edodes]KAH7867994.1 beta-lactamase/transpeptidase-like protein [Lentinula edodes]GAV99348.1 beta-lactamase transpeptidase-like protein [Lentinula edodes]